MEENNKSHSKASQQRNEYISTITIKSPWKLQLETDYIKSMFRKGDSVLEWTM
jgi:ribosomal protein S3AE